MSFDPNVLATNAEATSAMFRGQFQGLKALIDAIQQIANAQMDAVNTLPPGSPATGTVTLIGNTLHFTFSLPQGNDGAQGMQGQPGEVTVSEMNAADAAVLAQTSNNTNSVALLGMVADPSYQQWQMQDMANKIDELISAQRRS